MSISAGLCGFEETTRAAKPRLAIVLGSGLGRIADRLQQIVSVPFSQVPGLSSPSVDGHEGRLTLGCWGSKNILLLEGRLHFYEGHSWEAVVRPIHIIRSLGAQVLLATNAAGGIHPWLRPGSLMAIRDHLDWTSGVRESFPARHAVDCNEQHSPTSGWKRLPTPLQIINASPSPYSSRLIDLLQQAAAQLGMTLFTGVYAAVIGPNYETPAEIRALANYGADAVGMSTAREIQTACDLGLECAAISCITNRAAGLDEDAVITHQDVLHTAVASSEQLARLIEAFIEIVG
jgi:purine-nucleoside phosphorylase